MKRLRRLALSFAALLLGTGAAVGEEAVSIVPMTLTQSDYDGGRIYLPVRFGNVMGMMRLDTGASSSRIALAPWNRELPSLGESASTGASGRTTRCEDVEASFVALKASQGNDVARTKYVVTRCAASGGDDLLGVDFFKGARFTLDFDRKALVFVAPQGLGRPKPFRPLGPDRRLLGVELKIGDVGAVGLLDTGAEICAVDRTFMAKHRKLFALVKAKNTASEASGGGFASKIFKIKQIDLGEGRILRDVPALVYDFGPLREALGRGTPVVLGYNLASRFNWDLDFRAPDAPTWDARAR
ncbi:MAG TPA: aspartyl protease family protein [Methylocystis sp.]|nr:aspartyl protease family protein [Methylocystis sp.]